MASARAAIALYALGLWAGRVDAGGPAAFCGTIAWQPFIQEAADRFELPPSWIDSVIRAESAGCTLTDHHPTTSAAGAMGLMQLMPESWIRLREKLRLANDPHDPRDNILADSAYLRELYERFGFPDLFAAYHAGPQRLEESLLDHRPLPDATQVYLSRVLARIPASSITDMPATSAITFVVHRGNSSASTREQSSESILVSHEVDRVDRRNDARQTAHATLFVRLTRRELHVEHPSERPPSVQHE
jgi:hypothetical protein